MTIGFFILWIALNLVALYLISERIDSEAQFSDLYNFIVRPNIFLMLFCCIIAFIYLPFTIIGHVRHLIKK